MSDKELLHLVIGGELKDVAGNEFREPDKVEFVGAYPNYEEAFRAWQAKAQSTVCSFLGFAVCLRTDRSATEIGKITKDSSRWPR